MPRATEDLEAHAAKFWPTALAQRAHTTSIVPKLLESQEKFIGILYVADASPTAWKDVLAATAGMPANLFLKHLIVLSDVSGEMLQRYRTYIDRFFSNRAMTFRWKDAEHTYKFCSCDRCRTWTNRVLQVDGAGLARPASLTDPMQDVAMLLIHGGTSIEPGLPDDLIEKCIIGSLIGRKRELDTFVRQRYIHVSRITGGATANTMGQLCQAYVREHLQNALPNWDFSKHTIPGISQNAGRTDMSFDLVAESPTRKFCAIEVSFQVTTNSTIERKAGQAADRQRLLHKGGHKIAYVIDGAGNFQRRSALATICQHSDCTVTFKDEELDALAEFLRRME
ncbi:hypothetical protein [Fontivita pretiosa]|uniref:hypothetical protein n=1 Tax=Fontivita pretiosa TaxID=2989684 RepID=UPI003D17D260